MPYVYFIHEDNDLSMFKIGKTECHPADRMEQLQTGNPRKLRLYRWLEVTNHSSVEEYLHNRFRDVHIRGEWFYATIETIDEECLIILDNNQGSKVSGRWEKYSDEDRLDVKIKRKEEGKYKGKGRPEDAAKRREQYLDRLANNRTVDNNKVLYGPTECVTIEWDKK